MRAGGPRRPRSVRGSLAQIVLATEFIVVALSALVVFGLGDLPPGIALGGGAALLLLIVVAAGLATRGIGIALGWLVQVVFVGTIVLNAAVGIVGLIFAALWAYSVTVGGRIDRRAS